MDRELAIFGTTVQLFLDRVFMWLEKCQIDVSGYELDHLCYRVSTQEAYEFFKNSMSSRADMLAENMIAWRPIVTYKLYTPVVYKNREIYVIEFPAPKTWSDYEEWFEHVEFVISVGFEEFIQTHSLVTFDTKDISKEVNPDIRVKFDGFSVKFHHNSLEYVINNFD